jgi:hypothetical protein
MPRATRGLFGAVPTPEKKEQYSTVRGFIGSAEAWCCCGNELKKRLCLLLFCSLLLLASLAMHKKSLGSKHDIKLACVECEKQIAAKKSDANARYAEKKKQDRHKCSNLPLLLVLV